MDRDPFLKRVRRKAYALFLTGKTYECPFCKHSFRGFLSAGTRSKQMQEIRAVGIGRRPNARCPNCGSNDRARLLALYFLSKGRPNGKPFRVLEIAPDRHLAALLKSQPEVQYTCGALYPEDYADLGAEQVDVTQIPYADETFDAVLCNHVLQQVPDDRRAMRELARVLKPNGWGIIQSPIALELAETFEDLKTATAHERRAKFGSKLHVRIYGRDYGERLKHEGLEAFPTHPVRDGWCLDSQHYAVIPEEELYVVRRVHSS